MRESELLPLLFGRIAKQVGNYLDLVSISSCFSDFYTTCLSLFYYALQLKNMFQLCFNSGARRWLMPKKMTRWVLEKRKIAANCNKVDQTVSKLWMLNNKIVNCLVHFFAITIHIFGLQTESMQLLQGQKGRSRQLRKQSIFIDIQKINICWYSKDLQC